MMIMTTAITMTKVVAMVARTETIVKTITVKIRMMMMMEKEGEQVR